MQRVGDARARRWMAVLDGSVGVMEMARWLLLFRYCYSFFFPIFFLFDGL